MTLDQIAVKHLADKALLLPGRNGHGYAAHYDRFFSELRNQQIRVLEIGVDKGASIRMWLEYFPYATVFGVDNNPECSRIQFPRYRFVEGDQSSPKFWDKFLSEQGSQWDIIIDDGKHYADTVLTSYQCLWPAVNRGGYYAVEDLGTGYPNYIQGRIRCDEVYLANCVPAGWLNHKEVFKDVVDAVNLGNEIEFAFFAKELVILRKSL